MSTLVDYLRFNRFIMPHAAQLLFWAGIAGTLYGSWWLFTHGNWAWIMALVFGSLLTRLIIESVIIRYQTYLRLCEIKDQVNG